MGSGKDFVDMCAICKQGVLREDMEYQKGRVFHVKCFTEHGNVVPTVDPDLAHLSARTRIELVQLKNLKIRADLEESQISVAKKSSPPKSSASKSKAKKNPKKKDKKSKQKKAKKDKSKKHKAKKRR